MRAWPPRRKLRPVQCLLPQLLSRQPWKRYLSHVEHVRVRCASSGDITVSLHNVSRHPSSSPLILYIPGFSVPVPPCAAEPSLPPWLEPYPVAVLNYRWPAWSPDPALPNLGLANRPGGTEPDDSSTSPSWPIPLHDTLFGYSWVVENLAPAGSARRNVYVYGSYLGAGLAAGLALTETQPHKAMAVRGLVAYNGIYDWTSFLPRHPTHRIATSRRELDLQSFLHHEPGPAGSLFPSLGCQIPHLFDKPRDLFDPFASPCFFFLSPGLLVPSEFGKSALPPSFLTAIDALSSASSANTQHPDDVAKAATTETPVKHPRVGYLAFPPRSSTLKIPETLFLHEAPLGGSHGIGGRRKSRSSSSASGLARSLARRRRSAAQPNSFALQAEELARLMRRSVEMLELKERVKWDDKFDGWEDEAEKRVQIADVGEPNGGTDLSEPGQERVAAWLEERM